MYLNEQTKEKLREHVIDDMTNRSRWIAEKFEDDDYSKEYLIHLVNKNYKEAFSMCCTYGCVRFEIELIRDLMLVCDLQAVLQLNNYHLFCSIADSTSEMFDLAVFDYNKSSSELPDLIFG